MRLITDGMGVRPRRGDEEIQRLHPGVPGALGHDVKQLPVRLRVQLVKHHAVDVEAMLGIRLRRKHLVEGIGRRVDDPLL